MQRGETLCACRNLVRFQCRLSSERRRPVAGHRRSLSTGIPGETPPPAEPNFEVMDAAELRTIVKQLWHKSTGDARRSISAPGSRKSRPARKRRLRIPEAVRVRACASADQPTPPAHSAAAMSRLTKGALLDEERKKEAFKAISIIELQKMRDKNIPISMVTAYDYPSGLSLSCACLRLSVSTYRCLAVCLRAYSHMPAGLRAEVRADAAAYGCTGSERSGTRPCRTQDSNA